MSKRERIYLRVTPDGRLAPADSCAALKLRARRYRVNDLIAADLTKPRNPKFNSLIHKLGMLVVENIEAFSGLDAHKAIKRLQIEGRIACDEIGIMLKDYGMIMQFIPRSISFESMDESEFHDAAKGICRTISSRYWKDMTPEAIEQIASCMVLE